MSCVCLYTVYDVMLTALAAGDNNMFYEHRRQHSPSVLNERLNQHSSCGNDDSTNSCNNETSVRLLPVKYVL